MIISLKFTASQSKCRKKFHPVILCFLITVILRNKIVIAFFKEHYIYI